MRIPQYSNSISVGDEVELTPVDAYIKGVLKEHHNITEYPITATYNGKKVPHARGSNRPVYLVVDHPIAGELALMNFNVKITK